MHSRQQEITGAYVYSRTYGRYNPFLQAGIGGMIFTPIKDNGTSNLDTKQNTNIGALFGGGLAYEISPSFDIRVEYRGFVTKAPDFGVCELQDEPVLRHLHAGDRYRVPLLRRSQELWERPGDRRAFLLCLSSICSGVERAI